MSSLPEPVLADLKLGEMDLHEPIALRWAGARLNLLREAFAAAYRERVGVHPANRAELRGALEALRDGRTAGEVTVEVLVGRLQLNGESAGGS